MASLPFHLWNASSVLSHLKLFKYAVTPHCNTCDRCRNLRPHAPPEQAGVVELCRLETDTVADVQVQQNDEEQCSPTDDVVSQIECGLANRRSNQNRGRCRAVDVGIGLSVCAWLLSIAPEVNPHGGIPPLIPGKAVPSAHCEIGSGADKVLRRRVCQLKVAGGEESGNSGQKPKPTGRIMPHLVAPVSFPHPSNSCPEGLKSAPVSGLNDLRQGEAQSGFCLRANKEDLPRSTRTTAAESLLQKAKDNSDSVGV